jgi:hypothetical protein
MSSERLAGSPASEGVGPELTPAEGRFGHKVLEFVSQSTSELSRGFFRLTRNLDVEAECLALHDDSKHDLSTPDPFTVQTYLLNRVLRYQGLENWNDSVAQDLVEPHGEILSAQSP